MWRQSSKMSEKYKKEEDKIIFIEKNGSNQ